MPRALVAALLAALAAPAARASPPELALWRPLFPPFAPRLPPRAPPRPPLPLDALLAARQQPEPPAFLPGPDSPQYAALVNAEADLSLSYSFLAPPNTSLADFRFRPLIANPDLLAPEDVNVNVVATEDTALTPVLYNVTVDIDFNKWAGTTDFALQVLNASTAQPLADSQQTNLVVVGVSFYTPAQTGPAVLVGGPNFPLQVSTDGAATDVNLGVFVQYYDGTSSNDSLAIPLDTLNITTVSADGTLNYSQSCLPVAGVYEAADVVLPEACGAGFALDPDGRPHFGLDLNAQANASFTVFMEWNELVEGSDLEADGYTTFIEVQVNRTLAPAVSLIAPTGPFGTQGTDQVVVYIDNVAEGEDDPTSWTYDLSILFADGAKSATVDTPAITQFGNGTISVAFTLPAGSGVDLPWNLTITKPDAQVVPVVDATNPSFLFSFVSQLSVIDIQPSSGPEEGGITVSLIGTFPGFDTEAVDVLFDGNPINPELITVIGPENITFTLPPKVSIGTEFDVNVTVSIGAQVTSGITFSYIPSILLQSLTPASGPVEGGTQVTLVGQFIDFTSDIDGTGIYFGGEKIDSDLITASNSSVIVFTTPPQSFFASESVYAYDVSVHIGNSSSNSIVFSYDAPLQITSIAPNSGTEEGGTDITLGGTFQAFDLSNSNVYIGSTKIDSSTIVHNSTSILFITPPREEVGNGYTYNIWITIETTSSNGTSTTITSNTVTFTYEDVGSQVSIDASGGSFNSDGHYELGQCVESLYQASISRGARLQNASYRWSLVANDTETDILSAKGIVTNSDVLLLPYTVFSEENAAYTLTLTVDTDFFSFTKTLVLTQLSSQNIGVRIKNPRPRSISGPNTTLTIPADLYLPGCQGNVIIVNSTEMTYEWVFRGETYVFSHQNESAPEEQASPTLLGREFHIPQAVMEYGSFGISLTAYFTDQPSIKGKDTSTVVINPAALISQINGGEASQLISETESFTLSGSQSRDPDVLKGDTAADLQYKWSCIHSWSDSMSDAVECDSTLLADGNIDTKEFTVSSESLASIQNTSSRVHIQYGLQVSKTSVNATDDEIERVSDVVQSTLILAQEAEQSYESLQGIVVLNNQSVLLDKTSVKYYEDVIITPESATEETTWKFELLSPLSQTFTLLASDSNLLDLPGYFGARDEPGRLSLGLKANVLTPNTQYEFLVSSFRTGFSVNEQKISLTTVEKPRIILGNYATPTGTTEDTYVLSAYASYDGDFKFFFMLKDDFGFEMCVGGCQGENVVQFRLGTAGTYAVRCDVYDSLGYTLLANATGGSIVVSEELTITDLSQFGEQAEQAFLAGDHAIYQQLGADMVKHVVSLGESQSPDLDSEILANFTLGMNQVAANAVPNPIQSAGYVRMAASLASLTPDLGITFDTETLYYLVNITVSAIDRVPDNGALQVLEELLDFYDLTPELVLETYSQGTSRRRLLHEMQDSGKEVREIWLDIYEVLKNQVVLTVLKRCTCGCVEEVQTGVSSPSRISLNLRRAMMRQARNQSAIESYVNPIQGRLSPVSIKLAHFCNSEQGNQLKVDEDTVDEVRFSWCKGIFENSIKKLYFALAKTPDYIYLSQLRKNVTLSNGLVTTVIAELNGNAVEDATLPISNCYTVEMPMLRNFSDTGTSIPEEEQPRGIRLHPPKQWQEPASLALYNPIFSGLTTTVGDTASTSETEYITATVKMSSTGVLAVGTRIHWSGGLFSLEGIFLSAAEIAGVTVVIFVLVLGATISTWVVATKLIGQTGPLPPVEADFTYVERDVYGRGTALDIMEDER